MVYLSSTLPEVMALPQINVRMDSLPNFLADLQASQESFEKDQEIKRRKEEWKKYDNLLKVIEKCVEQEINCRRITMGAEEYSALRFGCKKVAIAKLCENEAIYRTFIKTIQTLMRDRREMKQLISSHSEAKLKEHDSKYDRKIWSYFEQEHKVDLDPLNVYYGDQKVTFE